MPRHEQKFCPRCGKSFECKVGNVLQCQCMQVSLTPAERAFMQEQYDDCLCAACMEVLAQHHRLNHSDT